MNGENYDGSYSAGKEIMLSQTGWEWGWSLKDKKIIIKKNISNDALNIEECENFLGKVVILSEFPFAFVFKYLP